MRDKLLNAVASFDSSVRKLTIRFLSSDGALIHASFRDAAAIRECSEDHTKIHFPRAISGDGARVDDRITVTLARANNSARVTTEIDRTQYIFFIPTKRLITYVAEFGVQGEGK